ncbi:MAG: hypothetical protein FWF09_03855 [Bacteroidales bacterium]|nr:hypothetical protein [Bacteroidales bacterium]
MNIGNYQSALDGLKQILADASAAMNKLKESGDTQGDEYEKLKKTCSMFCKFY